MGDVGAMKVQEEGAVNTKTLAKADSMNTKRNNKMEPKANTAVDKNATITCVSHDCIQKESSKLARVFPKRDLFDPRQKKYLDTILVKIPKCASTTMAGVILNLENKYGTNVAWRHELAKQKNNIKRDESFLLTSFRDPATRATSLFYFTRSYSYPSENNVSSEKFMEFLNNVGAGDKVLHLATTHNGGYQLMYSFPGGLVSAWSSEKPDDVLHPAKVIQNVNQTLDNYNFIVVVERIDESLVALALTMNIELADVVVMPSKVSSLSGSPYMYRWEKKKCCKIKSRPKKLPEGIEEYYD